MPPLGAISMVPSQVLQVLVGVIEVISILMLIGGGQFATKFTVTNSSQRAPSL